MNLVRAELLKIRTTSMWWVFGLITLPLWALSLLANWGTAHVTTSLDPGADAGLSAEQLEQVRTVAESVNVAATIYTSGQFLGVLMVLLIGAIVVTNEFHHQTATTTFLTVPRRESVVAAKVAAAALLALGFCAGMTVLNLVIGPFLLRSVHVGAMLDAPGVWRAIGLNAVAFGLWAVVGVGAGVLIRSQLGATITLAAVYLLGSSGAGVLFALLSQHVGDWIDNLQVLIPTVASQLMVSGTELPGSPPRWVGAVVLLGYAAVTGLLGTLIMKRRDVS